MKKIEKIAIIGGGNIGTAIAEGLIACENIKNENISITRRREYLLEHLKKQGITTGKDNTNAIKNADLVIFTVKPHQIEAILLELKSQLLKQKPYVVSVVAGVNISTLKNVLGNYKDIYRAMPNTAIALRESMTCLAGENRNCKNIEALMEFFDQLGKTICIDEDLMEAATVLGATGIAFALRFIRAATQGGIEIGFGSHVAELISAQTVKGAAKLLEEKGHHPEEEIDKVTTPMGITISGLNEMEHKGFSSALIKGILTSYMKIAQIKDEN